MLYNRVMLFIFCLLLPTIHTVNAECPPVAWQVGVNWQHKNEKPYFAIAALQQSLRIFCSANIEMDGDFGKQTETAISDCQKANQLPVTGKPDRNFLRWLSKRWSTKLPVPPITENPNTQSWHPEFTASTTAKSGKCVVTLSWPDQQKKLILPLSRPITACRLTEFSDEAHYVQALSTVGVMLDIKSAWYQPLSDFIAPVIVVWPDKEVKISLLQYEQSARLSKPSAPTWPNWKGPFENKGFDFHSAAHRDNMPIVHHNGYLWRRWSDHNCQGKSLWQSL